MAKKTFSRRIRNLIAVFRGLPIDTSRSFLKRARPVGDTVASLMKKISVTTIRPEHSLQEHWEMIIGSYLSHRCHPVKITNDDVLLIHSANAVVRSELYMQKEKILERIHSLPRCAKISDIRFIANQ